MMRSIGGFVGAGLGLGLLGLVSCAGSRGIVNVGHPQIHTRERLIPERQKRTEWLRAELRKSETLVPGFEGRRDLRSFKGTFAQLRGAFDPAGGTLGDARLRNDELALEAERWRLETAALQARRDYQAALEPTLTVPPPGGTGAPVAPAAPSNLPGPAPRVLPDATTRFSPSQALPSPADALESKARVHPLDEFRDRLALRSAIESELRQSQFDDAHDSRGGTLYGLTLDVSVLPGEASSEFVEVCLEIEPKAPDIDTLYHHWIEYLQGKISRDVLEFTDVAVEQAQDYLDRKKKDAKTSDDGRHPRLELPEPDIGYLTWARHIHDATVQTDSRLGPPTNRPWFLDSGTVDEDRVLEVMGSSTVTSYIQALSQLACIQWDGQSVSVKGFPEGRITFRTRLGEALAAGVQAYAVQPTELAQSISDVSAVETVLELVFALQATLAQTGADAEGLFQHLERTQERLHAVLRQPLVVGFARGTEHLNTASVGWVIGPKFGIQDGEAVFRHAPARYDVAAALSVPAWAQSLEIRGTYRWLHPRGGYAAEQDLWKGDVLKVQLPNPTGVQDLVTKALVLACDPSNDELGFGGVRPKPEIYSLATLETGDAVLLSGKERSIRIFGKELWRNPQVFVGNQLADRIEVLSSMQGLVAYFDDLQYPGRPPERREDDPGVLVDVAVATSYGNDDLPKAVRVFLGPEEKADKTPPPPVELKTRYLVKGVGRTVTFVLARPAAFDRFELHWKDENGMSTRVTSSSWATSDKALTFQVEDDRFPAEPTVVEVELLRFDRPGQAVGTRVTSGKPPRLALFPSEPARGLSADPSPIQVTFDTEGGMKALDLLTFRVPRKSRAALEVAYPSLFSSLAASRAVLQVDGIAESPLVFRSEVASSGEDLVLRVAAIPEKSVDRVRQLLLAGSGKRSVRLGYPETEEPASVPIFSGQAVTQVEFAQADPGVKVVQTSGGGKVSVPVRPEQATPPYEVRLSGTERELDVRYGGWRNTAELLFAAETWKLRPQVRGRDVWLVAEFETAQARRWLSTLKGPQRARIRLAGSEIPPDSVTIEFEGVQATSFTLATPSVDLGGDRLVVLTLEDGLLEDFPIAAPSDEKFLLVLSHGTGVLEAEGTCTHGFSEWKVVFELPEDAQESLRIDADTSVRVRVLANSTSFGLVGSSGPVKTLQVKVKPEPNDSEEGQ